MVNQVDFYCDIVARIPFEISEMIFQYLPLCQVFQAQRVSKKWQEILASAGMITSLLRQWYRGPDTTPRLPDRLSVYTAASLMAEHVDAYQRGKAFSMSTHAFPSYTDGLNPDFVAYADGLIAWADATDCYICKLLDLKTGNKTSFTTEDRSSISQLALSSSMIAVISMSGKCYLWAFQEQKSFSIRMPSARVMKVLISDKTLVFAFHPQPRWDGAHLEMITWTLHSRRTHASTFKLKGTNPIYFETKVMLDKEGVSVVLFERPLNGGLGEAESVHFTRVSLTGKIRARGVAEGPRRESHEDYARRTRLMQSNQHATIWAFLRNFKNERSPEVVHVRYNFDRNRVEYDIHRIVNFDRGLPMSDLFFHKDVAYYRHYPAKGVALKVIDFSQSTCTDAPMSTLIPWTEMWSQGRQYITYDVRNHYDSMLFGDENFLVNIFNGGVLVWSFDKDVKMANENIAYRMARGR